MPVPNLLYLCGSHRCKGPSLGNNFKHVTGATIPTTLSSLSNSASVALANFVSPPLGLTARSAHFAIP
jgi:hypothetical protein